MKRRISLVFCVLAFVCVLALGAAAATYEPDADGMYTVELDMHPASEYLMLVLKGKYDQTNYIEAYNAAKDSDILYFEQSASDEDGTVVFGPFAPFGYYDATVILGGTSLDEPYLAGYLSTAGVSNSASLTVSGIEPLYTVKGFGSEDYVISVEAQVFDSFGYPSLTNEKVDVSIVNYAEGISMKNGKIVIGNMAMEQTFEVVVTAGDAKKSVFVQVEREEPVASRIEIYTDEDCSKAVEQIIISAVETDVPEISVFVKTFDQYGEEMQDEYTYTYGGASVDSVFAPAIGVDTLSVYSGISYLKKDIVVAVSLRPDYTGSAQELFELINSARELLDEEKIISTNGKDIFPEDTWITQGAVDTFVAAISNAQAALNAYGQSGYTENRYKTEVENLTKALAAYRNAFKAGLRVDVNSISIETQNLTTAVNGTVEITATTDPVLARTTDVLTWTSTNENIAEISQASGNKAVVKGVSSGTVTITATTRAGLTASTQVTVIKKATQIMLTPSATSATFGGEKVVLKAQISPKDSTDVIEWTFDNTVIDLEYKEYVEGAYRVIEATVLPKSAGKTGIKVEAVYGAKSSEIKNFQSIMPDWENAAAPKASIESGSVLPGSEISLSSATANAKIYYTLDGSIPSEKNGRLYRGPIAIGQDLTLKAIAVSEGFYDSEVVTYDYSVVYTKVSVSSSVVRAGEEFGVSVTVDGFADIAWATIVLEYDPAVFSCETLSWDRDYAVEINTLNDGTVTISYSSRNGVLPDGEIAFFHFGVNKNALEGEYKISVTNAHACSMDDTIGNLGEFDAATNDGVITVNNYYLGDANNDGKITLADVVLIKQYAAGKESAVSSILLEASDVDADGDVDDDDATLVSQYCVGWNVTFGKQPEAFSEYRIVANADIGEDADGNWRIYYEVYNPVKGMKESDIPSLRSEAKAEDINIGILEAGTVVDIRADGRIDDTNTHINKGKLDKANLVWIKSANDKALVVVPVDNTVECKECVETYMADFDGTTYTDALGKKQPSNVVAITENTKFSVVSYPEYSDHIFKWGAMSSVKADDVVSNSKRLLSYNDKSLDRNDNYQTTYAEYIKAFVFANENGEAEFVVIIANGNDAAAYNVPCADCE